MDKKQALTQILEFLKLVKADPKAFAELEKAKIDSKLGDHAKSIVREQRNVRTTTRNPNMSSSFKVKHTGAIPAQTGVHTSAAPQSASRSLRNLLDLKQMPKPNLPKTEMVKNGDMIEAKMKNKNKEESMNKSVLDMAKELLKAHKENPEAFEKMTKSMAAPAMAPKPAAPKAPPAQAKAPAMKVSAKPAAPKAPVMKQEGCGPKMMSKEEIQSDMKKEWKPKFKKG